MTDDQTRRVDATEPVPAPGPEPAPPPATAPAPAYVPPPTTMPAPPSGSGPAAAVAAPAQGPGSSRARWIVGLGVAGLAIAIGLAAFLLLGARPTPEALRYIPGDSAVVAEVRLDLPGDQMQRVGNLLAHFPGFQDQSTLPAKIDEALSQALAAATDADVDFPTDIKPWLNGPTFIGLPAPPAGPRATPCFGGTPSAGPGRPRSRRPRAGGGRARRTPPVGSRTTPHPSRAPPRAADGRDRSVVRAVRESGTAENP